jgi:hypothetical protein
LTSLAVLDRLGDENEMMMTPREGEVSEVNADKA